MSSPALIVNSDRGRSAERQYGMTTAVRQIGFWSAVLTAVCSILFTVGFILDALGLLGPPSDVALPVGASLLLAPSFVVMMVAIHYAAPLEQRIWSHVGIAFALLYAALVSIVYVTWLFVVEPHVLRGDTTPVAIFVFAPGSFVQMVDGLGYTFMGVATLFTAPVFAGNGLQRGIRWLCLINGPVALMVFLAYIFYSVLLGAAWSLTFPALAMLVAVFFRRETDRD